MYNNNRNAQNRLRAPGVKIGNDDKELNAILQDSRVLFTNEFKRDKIDQKLY